MGPEQKNWDSVESSHQARDWLVRLHSGDATRADLGALARWRAASAAQEAAYQAELGLWHALGPALAAEKGDVALHPAVRRAATGMSRRQMMGGGAAVAASLAGGFLMTGTSAPAGATVLETAKGERRRVRLGQGLDVELNTSSRGLYWPEHSLIQLEEGELLVAVDYADGSVLRAAAPGLAASTGRGRFAMTCLGGTADITCIDGTIAVRAEARNYRLVAGQRVRLGESGGAAMETAAAKAEPAWRRGLFVFKDRPASEVVDEVNRYRPGRIYLPASRGDLRISGVIHLERVDLAPDHIARSLGMKVVHLPGGVAILRG